MLREMQEIQNLATKYSRSDLGRMVQLGLLDPQKAMMAGMMIQRIEQQNSKPPQSTVAQDVLGMPAVPNQSQPQQPPMPPQGMAAPMAAPPMASPPAPGIEALPAGNVGQYADGGIIAFADRGAVKADPDWGDLDRANREIAERDKNKRQENKNFIQRIFEHKGLAPVSPDKKNRVDNPLNFNMGPGLWKGTYATPYDDLIVKSAKEAGIDPRIYWRLLWTESKFDPKAVSYDGAPAGLGIAQISHHHGMTDEERKDPNLAIPKGANILAYFINRAKGDYRKGLEGYKGITSDIGRLSSGPSVDLVLGDKNLPPPGKKKLPPLKKGEVASYPVPTAGLDVKRSAGDLSEGERLAVKEKKAGKKKESKPIYNSDDIYDIGSGYFIAPGWDTSAPLRSDEYYQEGEQTYGGWKTPDEAAGLSPFDFARGGVASLPHGGIPHYGGASGSWVQGSAPSYYQDPFGAPDYSTQFDPDWLKQKIEEGKAYDPSIRGMLFGYKRVPQEKLPAITPPSQQDKPKDVGASLPPVVVTPTNSPEESPKASPSLAPAPATERRPVLRDLNAYRDKLNLEAALPPIPDKGDPDKARMIREEQYRKAGYDPELYNKMIEKIEERKGDYATEKERAIGEAFMQAGFKLMGARRGQEFATLSEGAQEGLKSYQGAMKEFKARQDKLDERTDAFRIADAQARKTGADSDIAYAQKQDELRQKAEEKAADAKNTITAYAAKFAVDARDTDAKILTTAMTNKASKEVAQIQASGHNGYGEAERLLAQYQEIERTKGKEAADKWLADLERVRGLGKPQNYFSYEEALKIVANNPVYAGLSPQEWAKKARELMQAQTMGSTGTEGWGNLQVTGGKK